MNKYCLKGKIECLHYHEPQKCTALDPHYCETSLVDCEQCPWPSRQVPVEPKQSDYDRGRSDMKRECVAKLKQAWVNTNGRYDVNKAITAIEGVK